MKVVRSLLTASLLLFALASGAAPPEHLPQNWSVTDWDWFYTTPQGSKLIPYSWALALEQPDRETLFLADGLARHGYLPQAKSRDNPDGLPVGFVKDSTIAEHDLGMTCAACHTSQISYRGTTYQIDGAPADADLFGFLAELSESLTATSVSADDAKFRRFAQRVLGKRNSAQSRTKLFRELTAFSRYFSEFVQNTVPPTPWGRARADAFGAIFNRVTAIDLKIPANNRPPNAPVSYPFLWDTSWHDVVQWNGSAPNSRAIERLARNVGEVMGVFARVKLRKPPPPFYASTANRVHLVEMEDRLSRLRAPKWAPAFPPIDQARASRGEQIYAREKCSSCHKMATPGVFQKVVMTPLTAVKTDPIMATNAATRQAQTGVLEGVPQFLLFGPKLGATAGAGTITFHAVVGAILSPLPSDWFVGGPPTAQTRTAKASTSARTGEHSEHELRGHLLSPGNEDLEKALKEALASHANDAPTSGLAYKARPLDGIWATAPFLHNGSVPTLEDLLLPVAQRPKTFHTGGREFDPAKVGFVDAGPFVFDVTKEGNSNAGHEWGTQLSAEERADLIEYLKSL